VSDVGESRGEGTAALRGSGARGFGRALQDSACSPAVRKRSEGSSGRESDGSRPGSPGESSGSPQPG